jgi:hypothetical protein
MAQVLRKEYQCFGCCNSILISKIDSPAPGSKKRWNQYEMDGITPHTCPGKFKGNKQEQHQQMQQQPPQDAVTVDNGAQIAELTKQVSDLKETVNILISQIQMLRSDVKS